MHTKPHTRIGSSAQIPVPPSRPTLSVSPVVLPISGRTVDLELRVTVPTTSDCSLPIILFSHGQGPSNSLSSLEGYAPLAEFWAAHGFAVLQPTHLSSAHLRLAAPPGQEIWWQQRTLDMSALLDHLDTIEAAIPGLAHRFDRSRVAVAGHSAGALTASMLLGATNTDPRDQSVWHRPDPRVKVGVYLAGLGAAGAHMSERSKTLLPFYDIDFSTMKTPGSHRIRL